MILYPCPEQQAARADRGAKRSVMTMTLSGGGVASPNYARSSRASHANWTNRLLPRAPQPPHTKPRLSLTDAAASPVPEPRSLFQCNAPSKRSPSTKHLNNNILAKQLLLICRVHYSFLFPESAVFVLSSVDFVLWLLGFVSLTGVEIFHCVDAI